MIITDSKKKKTNKKTNTNSKRGKKWSLTKGHTGKTVMEQKQKVLIVQTKWQTENHERTEKKKTL